MAMATLCDGCGGVTNEPVKLGVIDQLEYCEKCAILVKKFIEDRNALHEELAAYWEVNLEKLKANVLVKCPEMTLPDA